jgi:nucleotide-binding universal stress UspA family protein
MAGMTDGIIAGYDGSPAGDDALRWAAREAWARGTVLTICLAREPGDVAEILARGARLARSVPDLAEIRTVLAEGPPAHALCERSRTAEMVVVGHRGHGQLAAAQLGSVSWQVACHAQGRVVIVRGKWRPVNQSPGPVVAGVDGSPASRDALAFAFEEAALRDVPLVVVCALMDAPGRIGGARLMEEAFSGLMEDQEKEHPEIAVLRQVSFGAPRSALLTAAAEAQLLAVGARGLGGLEGMSLGSVAAALVHHSPCPIAVVHPRA